MNYLVSVFDCVVTGEQNFSVLKNVKYKLIDYNEKALTVISKQNIFPFVFDLSDKCKNIIKVKHKTDNYYFLLPTFYNDCFCTKINYKSKDVIISISSKITITLEGNIICESFVENVTYSHYETIGDLCLIYFCGVRNYLVVIKENELCFANYYDECNVNENEKYFMCKLYDSLNHGLVCEIKNKECTSYLVYLDNEEMNLKQDFVCHVFLDCVKATNYKYCNELLNENLKVKDEKIIGSFFPQFDYFYPLEENVFVLINKNALAGIYSFEIDNNKISNIITL